MLFKVIFGLKNSFFFLLEDVEYHIMHIPQQYHVCPATLSHISLTTKLSRLSSLYQEVGRGTLRGQVLDSELNPALSLTQSMIFASYLISYASVFLSAKWEE